MMQLLDGKCKLLAIIEKKNLEQQQQKAGCTKLPFLAAEKKIQFSILVPI